MIVCLFREPFPGSVALTNDANTINRTAMKCVLLWLALFVTSAVIAQAQPQTNIITTTVGAYSFTVNGTGSNPTLSLTAGVTNVFEINTSSYHPVVITSNPVLGDSADWYSGASPQNIHSGTMDFKTPSAGFPTKLYYMCSVHGFYGEIDLSSLIGPAPPPNTIIQLMVGTNIVVTSTGTNTTWVLVPQFSSNITSGVWATVPSFTNSFANGTNTTVFDRLDPICGPNVFLRISQQPH